MKNPGLTPREVEVLKMIWDGMATKEIAAKMFISEHTVIAHRQNIAQKAGTIGKLNIIGVLRWGLQHGYLEKR